jgi:hypothetical protein
MRVLRGPFSPSINHECGLLIDGFGASPCVLMSYNPPYYPEFYDRLGLVKARDLYAYWFDRSQELPAKATRAAEWVRRQTGLTVRPLNLARLGEEIARARAVFDRAGTWSFVPMTDEEWAFLAREFRPLLVPDLVLIAEAHGEPIGLLLALPDVNPLLLGLRKWWWPLVYLRLALGLWRPTVMRMALLGLVPDHQQVGPAAALYLRLHENGRRLGYTGPSSPGCWRTTSPPSAPPSRQRPPLQDVPDLRNHDRGRRVHAISTDAPREVTCSPGRGVQPS